MVTSQNAKNTLLIQDHLADFMVFIAWLALQLPAMVIKSVQQILSRPCLLH
jgi:hypothetical protein